MRMIDLDSVLETIRYKVCQGEGNKEHICKRGSCAYCGIMEIMSDISSLPIIAEYSITYPTSEYELAMRRKPKLIEEVSDDDKA